MAAVAYDSAPHFVRRDLADSHLQAWDRLASPGTWLDGAIEPSPGQSARVDGDAMDDVYPAGGQRGCVVVPANLGNGRERQFALLA